MHQAVRPAGKGSCRGVPALSASLPRGKGLFSVLRVVNKEGVDEDAGVGGG